MSNISIDNNNTKTDNCNEHVESTETTKSAQPPLILQLTKKKKKRRIETTIDNDEFAPPPDVSSETNQINRDRHLEEREPLIIPPQQDTFKKQGQQQHHQQQQTVKIEPEMDAETVAAVQALQEQAGGGDCKNMEIVRSNNKIIQSVVSQPSTDNYKMVNPQETLDYHKELQRLPDELSETAEAYEKVPIAEFGAALLRGMGWTGNTTDNTDHSNINNNNHQAQTIKDSDTIMPRPAGLGLGAIPKEITPGMSSRWQGRPMRPDQFQRDRTLREQMAMYQQQREAQRAADKQQTLQNGSFIYLLPSKQRARVVQLVGVPGLNMVSIRPENSQTIQAIKRSDIDRLVTRQELEETPYQEASIAISTTTTTTTTTASRHDGDRKRSRHNKKETKDRSSNKIVRDRCRHDHNNEMEHDCDMSKRDSENKKDRRSTKKKNNSSSTNDRKNEQIRWAIPNIRVRVITEKLGRRYYKEKGIVIDVTSSGVTLQLNKDSFQNNNSETLLDHVPERYLETALPKIGGYIVTLNSHLHRIYGRLLERNSRQGIIQDGDGNVHTLSLDDMAEWCGPLDDVAGF